MHLNASECQNTFFQIQDTIQFFPLKLAGLKGEMVTRFYRDPSSRPLCSSPKPPCRPYS